MSKIEDDKKWPFENVKCEDVRHGVDGGGALSGQSFNQIWNIIVKEEEEI